MNVIPNHLISYINEHILLNMTFYIYSRRFPLLIVLSMLGENSAEDNIKYFSLFFPEHRYCFFFFMQR